MAYTLSEAVEVTGRSRAAILRALQTGKLAATHDETTDEWTIEAADLFRLFPMRRTGASRSSLRRDIAVKRTPLIPADKAVADRFRWVLAVAARPDIFSDAEVRVLVVLGLLLRPEEFGIEPTDLLQILPAETALEERAPSADDTARISGAGLRTVRRTLARAKEKGFLTVRASGGRGRRPIYALRLPD